MAGIDLTLDELLLDLENPRISRGESQREALQKIIEDQDVKLVVLAESIVEDGLNPMIAGLSYARRARLGSMSSLRATAVSLLCDC